MTIRINDLIDQHNDEAAAAKAERDRLDRQISRIKAKIEATPTFGTTSLVTRIMAALEPHFPNYTIKLLGPFGIASETALHVYDSIGACVASITFRPTYGENERVGLKRIDYSRSTGRYSENSLGALNGLNRPSADLPETVDDLVIELRTQIAEHVEKTS